MQANRTSVVELVLNWIDRQTSPKGVEWLRSRQSKISAGGLARDFYMAFSGVPRYIKKELLTLSAADLATAQRIRPGWTPVGWSVDQAARALLILSLNPADKLNYLKILNNAFSAADVGEQVALYQTLPLLPEPEWHVPRGTEGIRTNISSVFNAVALDSPFPREYFSEAAFNQMVLKAVFVESPLHRIQGLDERTNAELAHMLVDFAHERWAAGRTVTAELWRPVGPYVSESMLPDLKRVLEEADPKLHQAAALALTASDSAPARKLLDAYPATREAINSGTLNWKTHAEKFLH